MYNIDLYRTSSGVSPVEEYINDLAKNNQTGLLSQIQLYMKLLEAHGFAINNVKANAIRKIRGDIWELRPKSSRVFFFHYQNGTFVFLHAYKKQGQKAPIKEIDKAEREMSEYRRKHYEKHN